MAKDSFVAEVTFKIYTENFKKSISILSVQHKY